jgi:hypothetical protein
MVPEVASGAPVVERFSPSSTDDSAHAMFTHTGI